MFPAPGDAAGTVVKQDDGARRKLATKGGPFFETIAQVRIEQYKAVPIHWGELMQIGERLSLKGSSQILCCHGAPHGP